MSNFPPGKCGSKRLMNETCRPFSSKSAHQLSKHNVLKHTKPLEIKGNICSISFCLFIHIHTFTAAVLLLYSLAWSRCACHTFHLLLHHTVFLVDAVSQYVVTTPTHFSGIWIYVHFIFYGHSNRRVYVHSPSHSSAPVGTCCASVFKCLYVSLLIWMLLQLCFLCIPMPV